MEEDLIQLVRINTRIRENFGIYIFIAWFFLIYSVVEVIYLLPFDVYWEDIYCCYTMIYALKSKKVRDLNRQNSTINHLKRVFIFTNTRRIHVLISCSTGGLLFSQTLVGNILEKLHPEANWYVYTITLCLTLALNILGSWSFYNKQKKFSTSWLS